MNAFFKNETIKSLLHVPGHISFSHRDPNVFYFLKVPRSLIFRLNAGRHHAIHSTFIPSFTLQSESNAVSRVSPFCTETERRQFDFRDGVASQTSWLSSLPWEGMAAFKAAKRRVWHDRQGLVAGYVTQSTNLTRVVLSNAGHMSPGYDNSGRN